MCEKRFARTCNPCLTEGCENPDERRRLKEIQTNDRNNTLWNAAPLKRGGEDIQP